MPHFVDDYIFSMSLLTPDQRELIRLWLPWMLVGAAALLLLAQIDLALPRATGWRRWATRLGVVGFDALALALLVGALSALSMFPPEAQCRTSAPNTFTAPGGGSRLIVYSFDCSATDRLFIVSMLKPGEELPYWNTADMLYQGTGSPRLAGDAVNVKVAWADAKSVTVSIAGITDPDIGRRRAFADEDVTVDLEPLR